MLSRKRFSCKWRWKLLVGTILFSCIIVALLSFENQSVFRTIPSLPRRSILYRHDHILTDQFNGIFQLDDFESSVVVDQTEVTRNSEASPQCFHMKNCFNFERCINGFYVYVYPLQDGEFISAKYLSILDTIKSSIYYTNDPSEACLFVLSLDTLDRDILSTDFVKHMKTKVRSLELWNNGENHLILNLFSGTFPLYLENLAFDFGKALIAKASFSMGNIRKGYDISLPLMPKAGDQSTQLPLVKDDTDSRHKAPYLFPIIRNYLLTFKGKRYLFGIGSETRNALHTINNFKDIILLTTCKHGKNWEKYQDERCQEDNEAYIKYDYHDLLKNSTFCLVPRGRRLGSFRFLEVMQYGCIPVLLSNGWDLPFQDVLDWSKFSLNFDERLLLQLPSMLREIPSQMVLAMRQRTLFVYRTFFATTETIVMTMLEELRERVMPNIKYPYVLWNQPPGAINVDTGFAVSPSDYPFYGKSMKDKASQKFTAVIVAVSSIHRSSSPLFTLIQSINLSELVEEILVVWLTSAGIPDRRKWPKTRVTLRVVHPPKKTMNARYINMDLIKTDAVFSFDEDVVINSAEIDFAFSVWLSNPDRLVGFSTASHTIQQFNDAAPQLKYTSKLMNDYSIVHTSSAVFHRYYSYHYINRMFKKVHQVVEEENTCESLAMNFLISKLTNKAPMKVAHSPHFQPGSSTKERLGVAFTDENHFTAMQRCFMSFSKIFGGIPLVKSKVAMNPVLYKDPVSIARKKYKRLE